jgi:hypothetical protein
LGIWLSSRLDALLNLPGPQSPVRIGTSEKTATAALSAGRFSVPRSYANEAAVARGGSFPAGMSVTSVHSSARDEAISKP